MKAQDMQTFIDAARNYLTQAGDTEVEVGAPHLTEQKNLVAHDYTGLIGISGGYKGCVYVSAPKAMLRHILLHLGEPDYNEDNCLDLVGEIANTLSGNARRHFGEHFMISVPITLNGAPERIKTSTDIRPYVIPLIWRSYKATLVICLEKA